jgi:hypothetical protein
MFFLCSRLYFPTRKCKKNLLLHKRERRYHYFLNFTSSDGFIGVGGGGGGGGSNP